MTEVSCTFVKCKYNDYGKKGICQAKYIQIGELVTPGTDKTEPVCVWFKKKAKRGTDDRKTGGTRINEVEKLIFVRTDKKDEYGLYFIRSKTR